MPQVAIGRSRPDYVSIITLFAISFIIHLALEYIWLRHGIFSEWNVLFDADPNLYYKSLASGSASAKYGGRNFAHPNFLNFLSPPILIVVKLLRQLDVNPVTLSKINSGLVLFISPLASAIRSGVMYLLLRVFGLRISSAGLVTLLDLVAFSGLIFGSLPESYPVSSLLFTVLFLQAISDLRSSGPGIRWPYWIGVGLLLTGVTITNILWFTLVLFVVIYRRGRTFNKAFSQALAASLAVMIMTLVCYEISRLHWKEAPRFSPFATGQAEELLIRQRAKPPAVPSLFPACDLMLAASDTVIPPVPLRLLFGKQPHPFIFTFRSYAGHFEGRLTRLAIFISLLGLSVTRWPKMNTTQRSAQMAAGSVLVGNLLFHAFYGRELFLYSQHWQSALILIIAGSLVEISSWCWNTFAFIFAIALVALNSVYLLSEIIALIS